MLWGNFYRRAYEGVNYRLRTFAGGRWASRCRPTSIAILLTERCNARCVHCDIWKNRGKEEVPTVKQWKNVLDDLRDWLGPVQVVFTGGEALLMPFATEVVAHGSSIGLLVEHLTHGYWLDQSRIEKLALANPWRITISLDGVGADHTRVRGRDQFFETVLTSIHNLQRLRRERALSYAIRFKTVIMEQNLDGVGRVAEFAATEEAEVFYQPIEQNYNTPEDPRWFEHSPTWPRDPEMAVHAVQQLIEMKRRNLPIANSFAQLEAMIPYFRDPDAHRIATQAHKAHEHKPVCSALTMLQVQSNGDVTICAGLPPVGNIKAAPIRRIWEQRPRVWEGGCCLEWRCSPAEKESLSLPVLS